MKCGKNVTIISHSFEWQNESREDSADGIEKSWLSVHALIISTKLDKQVEKLAFKTWKYRIPRRCWENNV